MGDLLNGGVDSDTLRGGQGNDTYMVDSLQDVVTEFVNEGTDTIKTALSYTLGNNLENLVLQGVGNFSGTGNALNNQLSGNSGLNTLVGGAGNDLLDGGLNADTLSGGTGDDTYVVDNALDVVNELSNQGNDVIQSSVNYSLSGRYVETLILTGTANLNGTGHEFANTLIGNSGNNVLSGGAGNDILQGGAGNDTLNGGTGVDTLVGGVGDDTYMIDQVGDSIQESAADGTDRVLSSVISIDLNQYSNIEDAQLIGTGALNLTGSALNNVLIGNSGNNTLSGGLGEDKLYGGTGDDLFIIDDSTDLVYEYANQGNDVVHASVNYSLSGRYVETLVLTGTANLNGRGHEFANTLIGNNGNNTLNGDAGNDVLDSGSGNDVLIGGTGADRMLGGLGNDTYNVENAMDQVVELSGGGTDLVYSTISYTLTGAVEDMILITTADITGTGNDLNNRITGNAGNNVLSGAAGNDTLNGGLGADTLMGGVGDDTYVADQVGDSIHESATDGIDRVLSSVISIDLNQYSNVEDAQLIGTGALNLTGSALNNILTGNSGNNTLYGGLGEDKLYGSTGDDLFIIDDSTDLVYEYVNQGNDVVQASVSYSLTGRFVETLILTGTDNINGTGHEFDNTLIGNSGNNILNGGRGTDSLNGGLGNDTYQMARGYGVDTITDLDGSSGNADQLNFLNARADQLWFSQVGNDLQISIIGTGDAAIVKDWYNGASNHVEQLRSSNGKTLTDSNVQNLVNAMASMTPPAMGETVLSAAQHSQLNGVIAANWT